MTEYTTMKLKLTKTEAIMITTKYDCSTLQNRPTDINWTRIDGVSNNKIRVRSILVLLGNKCV